MEAIVANWCNIFTEQEPYGEDISFSSQFETLEAEVNKSSSLYDCGTTDWALVIRLADEILSKESKDLWVFNYALVAYYHQHGLFAFANSLVIQLDFYKEHWEGLFPSIKRKARRLAPFLWLQAQIKLWENKSQYKSTNSKESKLATQEVLGKLQNFLEEKFDADAPTFSNLIYADEGKTSKNVSESSSESAFEVPQNNVQENPEHNTDKHVNKESTANNTFTPIITHTQTQSDTLIPKAKQPAIIRDIIDNSRLFAQHLLSQNNLDERAYLLHRSAIWGTLMQSPSANEEGRTQLSSGIPEDKLQEYKSAFENKQYREILFPLEISTSKSPFWLDGHYMVLKCLEELDAKNPYQIVKSCFLQLVSRFPVLLKYSFNNAMPFASLEVQEWYVVCQEQEKNPQTTFLDKNISNVNHINEIPKNNILQEAIDLGNEQNFYAGLRHLGTATSGKNKAVFTLGILQAQYCINAKKKEIALQLLEGLFSQLKEWDMIDWEPELTVQILSLLLSCKLKDLSTETIEQKRLLYRLNLDAALNLAM